MSSFSSATTSDTMSDIATERPEAFWMNGKTNAKWPAARNDHYCTHAVCPHAVIDLSSYELCESENGAHNGVEKNCLDEHDLDAEITNSFLPAATSRLPPAVRDKEQAKVAYAFIKQLKQQNLGLRRELDNLSITSAASYFKLEERLTALSVAYSSLSEKYDHLALKHDGLLDVTTSLGQEFGVHAECLTELEVWKQVSQRIYARVHMQETSSEVIEYGSPENTPTAEFMVNDIELSSTDDIPSSQDTLLISSLSPRSTPATSPAASAHLADAPVKKRPRLILHLPRRPSAEEERAEQQRCYKEVKMADSAHDSSPHLPTPRATPKGKYGDMGVKKASGKRRIIVHRSSGEKRKVGGAMKKHAEKVRACEAK